MKIKIEPAQEYLLQNNGACSICNVQEPDAGVAVCLTEVVGTVSAAARSHTHGGETRAHTHIYTRTCRPPGSQSAAAAPIQTDGVCWGWGTSSHNYLKAPIAPAGTTDKLTLDAWPR
jgi:hypothetical protein